MLDFVGGREDLRAGIVRSHRRCRLAVSRKISCGCCARFALPHASDTRLSRERLPRIHALAREIRQVSQERVRDELTKMLTEGRAKRAFELLDESGLLEQVLPEVARMKGVEQPPQFHPGGRRLDSHAAAAGDAAAGLFAHAGLGSAAARRGQASDFPRRSRPHTVRRARRDRHAHGGRDLPPPALQQSRYRADCGASRQSHALCRRGRR